MNDDLVVKISSMSYPSTAKNTAVIGDLSLIASPGSVISFLGPSGAGKTTLLRIIAGLERRYDGSVTLGGLPVLRPHRNVQIVFQDYRLLPWKTVVQNIEFATVRSGGAKLNAIDEWLKKVQLSQKKNSWPKDLSGGQEGRVAFARAFVNPPKVLLLDEPFRNLDLVTKFELQDVLLQTIKEHALIVLLVSHSIDDAIYLSDTIHLLSNSPMQINRTFTPLGDKPRDRNNKDFRELLEKITYELLSSKNLQI